MSDQKASYEWDVFVSHASEDKNAVVAPLVELLRAAGLLVWLDTSELQLGDSIRRKIDNGLLRSRFGIVVLSPHFFAKEWPRKELDALVAREDGTETVILPIWHNVDHAFIKSRSPLLADKLAVDTKGGLPKVAKKILEMHEIAKRLKDRRTNLIEEARVRNAVQLAFSNIALYRLSGEYERAEKELALTVKYVLRGETVHTLRMSGLLRVGIGQHDDAIKRFDEALSVDSSDVESWIGKGAAFRGLDRREEEIASYDMALRYDPHNSHALFRKAMALDTLGRKDEAIKVFEVLMEVDPRYLQNYTGGPLSGPQEQVDKVGAYSKLLAVDPEYPAAWFWKGDELFEQERFQEAAECYRRATRLQPQDTTAWNYLGCAYWKLRQPEKALEAHQKAVALNDQYGEAWYNMGGMLAVLGREDEAAVAFERARVLGVETRL